MPSATARLWADVTGSNRVTRVGHWNHQSDTSVSATSSPSAHGVGPEHVLPHVLDRLPAADGEIRSRDYNEYSSSHRPRPQNRPPPDAESPATAPALEPVGGGRGQKGVGEQEAGGQEHGRLDPH